MELALLDAVYSTCFAIFVNVHFLILSIGKDLLMNTESLVYYVPYFLYMATFILENSSLFTGKSFLLFS